MHVMHAPVPAAVEITSRLTVHPAAAAGGLAQVREKHARSKEPSCTRSGSPRAPASIAAVGLEGILSEVSSASSQKRRTSKKPRTNVEKIKAKNIEKSCSYWQNEKVPPAFKEYKNQGNASNLIQSHFNPPP